MIGMIDPAWKDEVVERAAASFEPCQNTAASGFEELELNGSAGLLLNDDRACTNPATADEIADLDFNDVASPELTVDREIEHRAVSKPPLSIQPEPDGIFRVSHCLSPLGHPWPKSKNWAPSPSTPEGLGREETGRFLAASAETCRPV
jgi:hypothetical protein